jgi:hypothetical protein
MANISGLILFKDYLTAATGSATAGPPISIKADDLDKNFRRVCIVDANQESPLFSITESGTIPKVVELDICVNGVPQKMRVIGVINTTQ